MAIAPTAPIGLSPSADGPVLRSSADLVWRAPLVPAALALTAGIVADRYLSIPERDYLFAAVAALAAWAICRLGRHNGLALVYLLLAVVAFGGFYHYWRHDFLQPDDISTHAAEDPRLVRVRGVVAEEPVVARRKPRSALQQLPRPETSRAVLRVTHLRQPDDWISVSGRVRLVVEGKLTSIHVGDEVEIAGWLRRPEPPMNPGEADYEASLRDRGIRAVLSAGQAVTLRARGWPWSPIGWLMVIRGWGQRVLQASLPADEAGVAAALLLGECSELTGPRAECYLRTGLIHVLAISGQHLVVLAWFLWMALRVLGMRRRRVALLVALFLLGYALLTGGRPSALRAAVTVSVICGGILLRRPVQPANTFALAWIVVALLNPGDLFTAGCQLSFISVAVLCWVASRWLRLDADFALGMPWRLDSWLRPARDPLERLLEETRPAWQRHLRAGARLILEGYLVNLLIWLSIGPLLAARLHLASPIALLIGPPVVCCASVALIAGFLLLLAAAVCWPLVPVFAGVTRWSLAACNGLVDLGDRLPGAYRYVPDLPEWWLWVFYLALLAVLWIEPLRRRWPWAALAGLAWLCIGLWGAAVRPSSPELRCTFLAVGHGSCIVIETPDGRVLLYDAGAMAGPDVTRRTIAPYLWHRGIGRIDELFLSHADLDHFNGLPALLDRFPVGRVTCTPTFANKRTAGVRLVLKELYRRDIPLRVVKAGDSLAAGGVELDVLHPPAVGPEGNENSRSLVLLVRHAGHSILLTGDLEGNGLRRVVDRLPRTDVDVLMAPHHGSGRADPAALAEWARPEVVVSCQGPPPWPSVASRIYRESGALFLGTWPDGAVTVRSSAGELAVETYRTGLQIIVRSDQGP